MKKGFTLIELLAVILILGIIALIAIPTVNNILKESRRGAFQSTLNNLEKAIEEKCTLEQIKNIEITTQYTIIDGVISPSVDIKGDLPNGTISVNTNCEVAFELSNHNFTGTKDFVGDITISDGSTNITTVYKEAILNGADPVLSDNLIPVTIANDGTVKQADINTKWYSYEEKLWANAVMLTSTGKVEDDGTILEDSIESYFVWIPRYKYKLFDMGNYTNGINGTATNSNKKSIEIVFENKSTAVSVGTAVGQYHSHPAFQAFDTNGFWAGKFETTGTISNIQIKPNKAAIKSASVFNMFNAAYDYKRSNDSHMMKNTEWGAVAYLSLSKYGIDKEININNNSVYKTGYSSVITIDNPSFVGDSGYDSSITVEYNTITGYLASTTGNITGVYDMSGGTTEYMAAYINNYFGNGGFTSDPVSIYGSQYFDIYNEIISGVTNYNYRILGDATGETGPFYILNSIYINNWGEDLAQFITTSNPWFARGGLSASSKNAGQLSFDCYNGAAKSYVGFRIVLVN